MNAKDEAHDSTLPSSYSDNRTTSKQVASKIQKTKKNGLVNTRLPGKKKKKKKIYF